MKNKRKPFKVIGKTKDGKLVIEGIFSLLDTSGLPLDAMLDTLLLNNMIPSWFSFYNEAKKAGWIDRTIYSRLQEAISTVYGSEFSDIVIERLKIYGTKPVLLNQWRI